MNSSERTCDEIISDFRKYLSELQIEKKDQMILLGMVYELGYKHYSDIYEAKSIGLKKHAVREPIKKQDEPWWQSIKFDNTAAPKDVRCLMADYEYVLDRLSSIQFAGMVAKGYATERELYLRFRGTRFKNANEFRQCLNTLADLGYVRLEYSNKGKAGRPSVTVHFLAIGNYKNRIG